MNFIIRFSILALLFSASSCGLNQMDSDTTLLYDQTITINEEEREYHIQTPNEPVDKPIVILLHGHSGSSDQSIGQQLSKSPQKVWLDVAKEDEFTLVIPNGNLGPEDSRGWNDCRNDAPGNPESDDVLFISELLDQLQTELNYDQDRVYIAGVSNGASMSIRLAQELPNRITAFASIITTMPVNSECTESDIPISALFMNGTEDPLAPYDGGEILGNRGLVQSTTESIDYWIERNGTDSEAVVTTFDNINEVDNSTVEKFTYANGTNDTEVVLYRVNGGGHTSPSILERYNQVYLNIVGIQNGDIEMAREVWDFFKTKSK